MFVAVQKGRRYEEAGAYLIRSLEVREEALGSEHPDLVLPLLTYADLLRKMEQSEEADRLEDRAARIRAAQ